MKIELIELEAIKEYKNNPRCNQSAVIKVAASIKEFGWQQPIVVDANMVVIAGHTRLQAAHHLKLKQVPVYVANALTEQQVKAYRLADNRLHEDASWDNELLAIELECLQESEFDLELTGFNPLELKKLLSDQNGTENDADSIRSKEICSSTFEEFEHQCPKCKFEWS
ncbi:MAG: hypothetical protein DGJ47_000553 [Rickettsiaceae bacterium]